MDVDKLIVQPNLSYHPRKKPTSSPTLCSVWEKWDMIPLRPGRAKLNGIRTTITSRIWIESSACRRSSSGKYSQESQRWPSSRSFKVQWETYSVNLSSSKTGSSSCQCTTTLHGEKKETQKDVNATHRQLQNMLENSLAVIGLSWSLDQKRNGTEPAQINPTDRGIEWQKTWWQISQKKYIHFNDSTENIELLLRTNISVNQLSIYGAAADLCGEVPKRTGAPWKPAAPEHLEKIEIPTDLSNAETHTNAQQRGNLVQEYERKFEQLSDDQKLSKLCSDAGLKLVEIGQYIFTLDTEEGQHMGHLWR